jgi:hypothetical protein
MINQNARQTGAAGVMARALGTLGAATLLLTSTGWGALAGDTGFGAINLKAYQGAAAAVPGPAPKGGGNDSPGTSPIGGALQVFDPIMIPPAPPSDELPSVSDRPPRTQKPGVSPTLTLDGEKPSGPPPTSTYSPFSPTGTDVPHSGSNGPSFFSNPVQYGTDRVRNGVVLYGIDKGVDKINPPNKVYQSPPQEMPPISNPPTNFMPGGFVYPTATRTPSD